MNWVEWIFYSDDSLRLWNENVKRGSLHVKGELVRVLHHATKTYGGVEVWLHAFLTSALDLGEWSASRHCRFTPRERTRGTDWIGGWVGPRVGLAAAANGIISVPAGNRTSVVQPRSLVTLKFTLFRATKDVTWTFTARSSALLNIS
jgi:hypothetical protein